MLDEIMRRKASLYKEYDENFKEEKNKLSEEYEELVVQNKKQIGIILSLTMLFFCCCVVSFIIFNATGISDKINEFTGVDPIKNTNLNYVLYIIISAFISSGISILIADEIGFEHLNIKKDEYILREKKKNKQKAKLSNESLNHHWSFIENYFKDRIRAQIEKITENEAERGSYILIEKLYDQIIREIESENV